MADDREEIVLKEGGLGEVEISNEVMTIIAGIAATEVEGVVSIGGNITRDIVARLSKKNLSKGIRVDCADGKCTVDVTVNIRYGYSIPQVSAKIQEKVSSVILNMTGIEVTTVNVTIADVDMKNE